MIIGVLLVYYERYHLSAVTEFQSLLNQIDENNRVVVVTNNPELKVSNKEYILGEDLSSEFSGYDVGIKQVKNIASINYIVFANDTFCHHRHWGSFEKRIFSKSLRSFVQNKVYGLAGEVNTFEKNFRLINYQASHWVSTYLFCTNLDLLKSLNYTLSLDKEFVSKMVGLDPNKNIKWGDDICPNIKNQLSSWLSATNRHGWHNRQATISRKIIKIYAILNEFYLSAFAINNGFKVVDIYQDLSPIDRVTLRWIRLKGYIKSHFGLDNVR